MQEPDPAALTGNGAQESSRACLLTAVELAVSASPHLSALRHVAIQVDSFLFSSEWTLEKASERGYLRLLDRLLPLEWYGVSDYFREQRFSAAINQATNFSSPKGVLKWWMTRYLPGREADVARSALQAGDVETLEWLRQRGKLPLDALQFNEDRPCYLPDIAHWIHDHAPHIQLKLNFAVNYCDSFEEYVEFIKWGVQHRDIYEIVDIAAAMDNIAESGLLVDLKWLQDQIPERCTSAVLEKCLRKGHLAVAKWLYETYSVQYFDDPLQVASDLEVAHWAMAEVKWKDDNSRVICIDNSVHHAISQFDRSVDDAQDVLRFIQYLYSVRPERNSLLEPPRQSIRRFGLPRPRGRRQLRQTTEIMDEAASSGLLEVVQWLHANDSGGCTPRAMDQAAANGHLDIVQWLHSNRSEGCTIAAMSDAIARNRMPVVLWLHENRTEGCSQQSIDEAAGRGLLEMVQWLHANRTEGFTVNAMKIAACRGEFKILKWLLQNRSEGCTSESMDLAAREGHLDIMKYLYAHLQCGWTNEALKKAVENGHLDVLIWLMETKPFETIDQESVRTAAKQGYASIVKMLAPKHIDLNWDSEFLSQLAEYRQFATIEWALKSSLLREEVLSETRFMKH